MVAPIINDGSPVHGYNLFKYQTNAIDVITKASGTGFQQMRSYSYLSGAANDGLLVFYDCHLYAGGVSEWGKGVYLRQSGATVTDTIIGSIFLGTVSEGTTAGIGLAASQCVMAGSVNQDFDLILEAGSIVTNNIAIKNYQWGIVSF